MSDFLSNFKLWSERSEEIKLDLMPIFDEKKIDELSDKTTLWKHLKPIFFKKQTNFFRYEEDIHFKDLILITILKLNNRYKLKSYGKNLLELTSSGNITYTSNNIALAQLDFEAIFKKEPDNVILELFSIYFEAYLTNIQKYVDKNSSKNEREEEIKFRFNDVAEDINDIFNQFSLPYILTLHGFIPKQDKKIIEQVYEPVLMVLSDKKWEVVSNLLRDSFSSYQKNTSQGFSDSITNSIAALEAFLQIKIYGEIGKGTLGSLVPIAIEKKIIPDDNFSKAVVAQLSSFLARERKETGIAHPKKEYANDKNCRLLMNIVMIFIQHSI